MNLEIHHLGYAVPALEKGREEFEALGWECYGSITDDVVRKVRIQFMRKGTHCIELVAPLTDNSPIRKILEKGSGSPYHICYEVDSLDETEKELKAIGFLVFKKAAPAPAIDGRRVEWFFGRNTGIIEIVEKS